MHISRKYKLVYRIKTNNGCCWFETKYNTYLSTSSDAVYWCHAYCEGAWCHYEGIFWFQSKNDATEFKIIHG